MPPLKPVVFVPGFPASELRRRGSGRVVFPPALDVLADSEKRRRLVELLSDPAADLVAGEPIRALLAGIGEQAESLYDDLRRYHYTTSAPNDSFQPVGWDWRKAIDDAAVQQELRAAITRLADAAGRPVVVVVHSTGGVILRRLLEAQPALAARIQVLACGVPWAGALKVVRYAVQGEALKFFVARVLTAAQVRRVMRAAQAPYDLFPPDPARTDLTTPAGEPLNLSVDSAGQVGLCVDTRWLPGGAEGQAMLARAQSADARVGARASEIILRDAQGQAVPPPPIVNLVGWGRETEVRCTLRAAGAVEIAAPTKEGDGTVPLVSASWLRGATVRTFFLPIGVYGTNGIPQPHHRIWDSPPVDDLLDQVLADAPPAPWVCAAADGDEALDRRSDVTVRVAAQDGRGDPLPDARVTFPGVTQTVTRFEGRRRVEVKLRRTAMRPNVGSDQFRFEARVQWAGGGPDQRRELVLLVRA